MILKTKLIKHSPIALMLVLSIQLATGGSDSYAQFKINTVKTSQSLFFEEKNALSILPRIRYNRVQGLLLGVEFSAQLRKLWELELQSDIGYGFKDKLRYRFGIQKGFFEFNPLMFGVNYFNDIASQDEWFISYHENTAAALFFKEDFMDYHIKKGFMGFVDQKVNEVHTVRLEAERFQLASISKNTNWALFGKNKHFRENPSTIEEIATALRLLWVLDWRDNPLMPMSGWYIEGKAEQTWGDSADTRGLFLTLRRYQMIGGRHLMKVKLMLGSRNGCDNRYDAYLMDMGGISTLHGFKDREFRNGNRFVYGIIRYNFSESLLRRLPLKFIPFYDQLSLAVFAEAGWLDFVDTNINVWRGFHGLRANRFKSDIGLSLYVTEGLLRIDFARRTDRSDNAWRVTFRVMKTF
ncbi:MAG: BamA/TamA family outer membrane protein [bacterium]|nr:BamA/TamA family outer membrane protein [bacterium]